MAGGGGRRPGLAVNAVPGGHWKASEWGEMGF